MKIHNLKINSTVTVLHIAVYEDDYFCVEFYLVSMYMYTERTRYFNINVKLFTFSLKLSLLT